LKQGGTVEDHMTWTVQRWYYARQQRGLQQGGEKNEKKRGTESEGKGGHRVGKQKKKKGGRSKHTRLEREVLAKAMANVERERRKMEG
jgi:hypothetical protein